LLRKSHVAGRSGVSHGASDQRHPTAFTTNRDRLLEGEVASTFLAAVLDHARVRQLLSREHFPVDGTLIEAWAGPSRWLRRPTT
jgi:hypothetical protein